MNIIPSAALTLAAAVLTLTACTSTDATTEHTDPTPVANPAINEAAMKNKAVAACENYALTQLDDPNALLTETNPSPYFTDTKNYAITGEVISRRQTYRYACYVEIDNAQDDATITEANVFDPTE